VGARRLPSGIQRRQGTDKTAARQGRGRVSDRPFPPSDSDRRTGAFAGAQIARWLDELRLREGGLCQNDRAAG